MGRRHLRPARRRAHPLIKRALALPGLLLLAVAMLGCGTGCGADDPSTPSTPPGTEVPGGETPPEPEPTPLRMPGVHIERPRAVGTNLAEAIYWSGNMPFVDLFKHTDPWISGTFDEWDDHRPLAQDEHGWVTRLAEGQIARAFLLSGDLPHETGRFTVLYEGEGEMLYHGRTSELTRSPGRDTFVLNGTDGLYLEIHRTNPANPIRNVRVLAPGGRCENAPLTHCRDDDACEGRCVPFEENYAQLPFHPTFLSDIAPFAVLRFMDWQQTNRERVLPDDEEPAIVRTFDQLPTREDARWRPAPIDVMVDLANLLDADPWFNMPTLADDDLVRRFAQRVAERLEPERRVYVEVSNEVWNDIFDQHQWFNAQGCQAHAENPREECDPDGNGVLCEYTPWNATQERCMRYGRRAFAQRTVEVGAIWREVFAEHGPERVQRVLATQIGGADWWVPELLEVEVNGAPAHAGIDVVATAPYFGGGGELNDVESVFERVDRGGASVYRVLAARDSLYDWIQTDLRGIARLNGAVRYVAYEGGQHLHGAERFVLGANQDPRMESLYGEYLTMWSQLTDDALFVHFTSPSAWSRYGAWGSKSRQGQPLDEAPKHRALLQFIAH